MRGTYVSRHFIQKRVLSNSFFCNPVYTSTPVKMSTGSPTHILRLRECGAVSHTARKHFYPILNVRSIAFRRELNDKYFHFDEQIAPRNEAYRIWVEKGEALYERRPQHAIDQLEEAYAEAIKRVKTAAITRAKRNKKLTENIMLIRAEMNT